MFSMGGLVYAQQNENVTTSEPRFMSIQTAQSGSISQINATAYTLELKDIANKTILFSERPDRLVTSINTSQFVDNWSSMEDSFAIDPPNAALVVIDTGTTSERDIALMELFNPEYNAANMTLIYDVRPDNATTIDLPDGFGQATIIIDSHTVVPPHGYSLA